MTAVASRPSTAASELNDLLGQLAEVLDRVDEIDLAESQEIDLIRARYAESRTTQELLVDTLVTSIYGAASTNKISLIGRSGGKSVTLGSGHRLSWRDVLGKLQFKGSEDELINRLRKLKQGRFIRLRESVNRQALRAAPDVAEAVGATMSREERFLVKLAGRKTPISQSVKELRAKLRRQRDSK